MRRITASSGSVVRKETSASASREIGGIRSAEHFGRGAQHGAAAGVRVLHIKNRVVAGLCDDLVEIKLHLRVGLARQHGEADGILADLVEQVAEGFEGAGALGHADDLAPANDAHDLAEQDLKRRFVVGDGAHGGANARHVAAVIGAEHVDQMGEAARDLVGVIGNVAGEVGVGASDLRSGRSTSSPNFVERNRVWGRGSQSSGSLPFGGSSVPS